jgi:hypothetical protein
MKSKCTLILLAAAWLACPATSLWAEDWKTTDGKVYQDVEVIRSQPDAVTILHKEGGALVPLDKLPPDLQKRFNYDPVTAKAAADARVKDDAENAKALQAEMDQASEMRQPGAEPQDGSAAATSPSPADDAVDLSTTPASGDARHHSLAELDSYVHTLKVDSSDTTHHSIDELSATADTLRRDLYDPTYHTMAHLSYSMRLLGPDPSDPNHHTISEIGDSGL